jgi:hypothetical protein
VQCRINVTGPLLKEMALKFSADLKIDSFKAFQWMVGLFYQTSQYRFWKNEW